MALTHDDIVRLRQQAYNARLVGVRRVHEDLAILRVRPDSGMPVFEPGQYTVLGLGSWEPCIAGMEDERSGHYDVDDVIKRAYSVSCSMLDEQGRLSRVSECPYLEFYVSLVRAGAKRPPALTPRIFRLGDDDRLFCGPQMHGHYGLQRVRRDDTVVFAATGTGEAPHNAMLTELLAAGHRGRIVSTTCVRWRRDLAYLDTHRELERRFGNYRYLPLTTREPENVDPTTPSYVGKRYLQEYFSSGDFEHDAQLELSTRSTHVFLCGGPLMIGVPHHTHDPAARYPTPMGMVEVLEHRGFRVDQPHEPGNVHFEKYW